MTISRPELAVQESTVDPAQWRIEVERVTPLLKVQEERRDGGRRQGGGREKAGRRQGDAGRRQGGIRVEK